ncbi:MAG: patatin-like phospholipase family protein [Desulfobacterales bacterium]|jgi:NTE family protein|nr:patatin-like phospholipase family protein [Desulfobacterales bacterium]
MKTRSQYGAVKVLSGLVLAGILLAASFSAGAAEPPRVAVPAKRAKIGLVLSGGGARGAAHVGVLKVLEEYRVPIDFIVGTSMGALVGASYATGTSVAEMEEIIGGISTELLFKDKPPRQELSMRRKQDDYNIFFGPEIGIKDGKIGLPKGAVSGVQLETVLRRLSKAKGFYRFDDLPIPYRAVATDLVTGKAVIFSEGELANVMRASMSVPGAIAPVEIGGKLLVDGMLTSNMPVETARAMGADVIIAVNVGTPLLKRDELNSILGVMGQMLSILTEQNVQASIAALKPTDILISPELGDYSTGDFDSLTKISPLGETAARKVAERLAALSIPAAEYAALRQHQMVASAPDLEPVDEIRFENLKRVNPKTAQVVMETEAGQPIDQEVLDRDMRRLYGTGYFEHVNYRFMEEPAKRVLAVDAVEKSWGPNFLRLGLGLSSDLQGDAYFNVLASYRKTWLNSLGAEWRNDVQIGRTVSFMSEFYQPLNEKGFFFIAPHVLYERRTSDLYQGSSRIATYDMTSYLAGADLGGQFTRYGELRVGVKWGLLTPKLDTGPESLTPGQGDITQGAFTARLFLDQLDSAQFPRSGWRLGASLFNSNDLLSADQTYTKWDSDGNLVYSFGSHTFNLSFKAGGSIGSESLPRYNLFQWGGFLQQSGYATGQLLGEEIKFGRLMYYHRLLKGSLLEGAYGGLSFEVGEVDKPLVPGSPEGVLESACVFVAADTPIGPVYLGYGQALEDNSNSLYFYLGRPF